jgi:hypothetical protein
MYPFQPCIDSSIIIIITIVLGYASTTKLLAFVPP